MAQDRPLNPAELVSVLEWYRAAGVDVAVGEEPVNRFAQRPPARAAEATISRDAAPESAQRDEAAPVATPAFATDPGEARSLAATAQSLVELEAIVGAYDGCGLKLRATQLCFADGNPQAQIMLIATRNFTLDRTLGAIELLRQDGITGLKAWLGLLNYMWVRPGMMRRIFRAWAAYFMPGFHPWNEDDRHLIKRYEAETELGTESGKKVRRAA